MNLKLPVLPTHLWFPGDYRTKEEIKSITRIFIEKLFPAFNNSEKGSDEYSKKLFNNTCQSIGHENFDLSDAAEAAMEKGIEYYQTLSLARYGFTAFSISLLYHFWEQQIRKLGCLL